MVAVRFVERTGLEAIGTVIIKLYPISATTELSTGVIANGASGDACTEVETNVYEATVSQAITGWHKAIIELDGSAIAVSYVLMSLVAVNHWCGNYTGAIATITVAVTAIAAGSAISIHRGDTTTVAITALGNISTRTKLWFVVKRDPDDSDGAAMVFAVESSGLATINGRAAVSGETCTITVTDETAGNLTIVLNAAASKVLPVFANGNYDIQMLTATGVTTLAEGSCEVTVDVTQAVA